MVIFALAPVSNAVDSGIDIVDLCESAEAHVGADTEAHIGRGTPGCPGHSKRLREVQA